MMKILHRMFPNQAHLYEVRCLRCGKTGPLRGYRVGGASIKAGWCGDCGRVCMMSIARKPELSAEKPA